MQLLCYEAENSSSQHKRLPGISCRIVDIFADGKFYGRMKFGEQGWQHRKPVIQVRDPDDGRMAYFAEADTVAEARKLLRENLKNGKPGKKLKAADLPASADVEFYPTPPALAGKMFAGIDWKEVHSVLEPSAGKGDLLDALHSFATNCRSRNTLNRFSVKENCDVIELDTNLQFILRGKGYHLIADNFLNLQSPKRYDLILMNPPFSEGDKHLMKALMMQEKGGQICCILNAETIRNPYTMLRKKLMQVLIQYNARIEFVKGAFRRAEQPSKTNKAHKVGNKCIIPVNGCFAASWRHERLDDCRCFELLDDLEKVMNYLDRGDTAFHCNLQMELRRANAQNKPKVETTYFDATFYKKGTCHIKFKAKAQHIIDRLNIYTGLHRNWLPPYYGKVKYDDLDAEGRSVIDSFQGKAEYEKVFANAASYLPEVSSPILGLAEKI